MKRIIFGALTIAVAWATAAVAQTYPGKPIRIIIPFPPGNTMDIMARLAGPKISERLGQNVIVDNRAGASGQLGLELAARAAPDGYTLVGGQGGNLVVMPHTYKKIPYDPLKDFVPIALSTTNFLALVVHPSVPFKSVKDLITVREGESEQDHVWLERRGRVSAHDDRTIPRDGRFHLCARAV